MDNQILRITYPTIVYDEVGIRYMYENHVHVSNDKYDRPNNYRPIVNINYWLNNNNANRDGVLVRHYKQLITMFYTICNKQYMLYRHWLFDDMESIISSATHEYTCMEKQRPIHVLSRLYKENNCNIYNSIIR